MELQCVAMTRSQLTAAISLLLIGFATGKFGCRALIQHQRKSRLSTIEERLERHSQALPKTLRTSLKARMKAAENQLDAGELSPIALDTLRQRSEAILADGLVYPREAQHLIALLEDFPTWQDEVHALKYMGQR